MFGWSGWAKLASISTTIAALAALWFTSQSLHSTSAQYGLARQTAVTERFTKAVEQLGKKDSVDVRLGGIYSLERLAADSPDQRSVIFEVLSAFVRTHAPVGADCTPHGPMPSDVQAVLTVIGRRTTTRSDHIDLSNSCLMKAQLKGADLHGIDLEEADLTAADLEGANLTEAKLEGTKLTLARLPGANLTAAVLKDADLDSAALGTARLEKAVLIGANLRNADLEGAVLNNAFLFDADLRGTIFELPPGAGFKPSSTESSPGRGVADGARVLGADVSRAICDDNTLWPGGVIPALIPAH